MKTIEQKAKAYDKAIERAKEINNEHKAQPFDVMLKVFPELAEPEDERIRKEIVDFICWATDRGCITKEQREKSNSWLAWLEKQGEQKPDDNRLIPQKGEYYVCIKDYYSAGGKTTNTKGKIYKSPCDGYINEDKGFGLSWINSSTENHFRPIKEEDWVICEQNNVIGKPLQYKEFMNNKLIQKNIKSLEDNGIVPNFRLWDISDAKDGDVLACNEEILLFKSYSVQGRISLYCWYNGQTNNFHSKEVVDTLMTTRNKICPATKEQRDTLIKAMTDAGYTFDFEKKELKKIEEEYSGEDYGIDSLFHAQRILEKTLGKVEGYQSDDGILEHKCAISAIKKLYRQKPAWSGEDDYNLQCMIAKVNNDIQNGNVGRNQELIDWLKSIKKRMEE
jgi:hypothetical protein